MKIINDFKIIDGVAVLEGVAYAEEAKVVDEFLKSNSNVKYASVYTKDNRHFELKDNKLFFTKEKTFKNPYYKLSDDTIVFESECNEHNNQNELENRITTIENTFFSCYKVLQSLVDKLANK